MKRHYGWVVCAGCFLLHLCACGLVSTAFTVYLPYIKTEVGLSYIQTSMITTIRCLSSMLAMLAAGKYYSKLSLRLGTTVACLFLVAACILFSLANSAILIYLAAILMGISYAFGSVIAISMLLRNWFQDRRSTAMAISVSGSSVSVAVTPPIVTRLVESQGLSMTFVIEGIFVAVCAVIIFLILRDSPADMGYTPYQEYGYEEKSKEKRLSIDTNLKKWEILLLMFAVFLVGFAGSPCTSNLSIHYTTAGYTSIQTATALSLVGIFMLLGKFMFGITTDKFGTYFINYFLLGGWALANFITAMLKGDSVLLLYLTTFLHGIGLPAGTIGIVVWVGDLSSAEKYAQNIQISQSIFSLGTLLGNPIPGILADVTGSYSISYIGIALLIILTLVIVQLIYRKHSDVPECLYNI